uniref:Putative double-stranded RNA-binding protein 4 isoform X3 n=1 Tax=Davidia involucrata TaxID=16924 RepID=A0A5B7AI71_DAVIN
MAEQSTGSQEPQPHIPEPEKTGSPAQSSANLPENLLYKNRLQEYTQRSSIPLPIYQTINEGVQHAPTFRSTVLVDGSHYTSPNTFSHRKAAEQDVAKVALAGISQKIKDEGCPLINEDTVFCKSILNEYAVKMNMGKPTYETIQPEGLLPVFVSSLVFNGVTYTGDAGRNKKEAEQLAARAVILSILGGDSSSATVIFEIIKSKFRLYAALHKVKDSHNTHNGISPVVVNSGNTFGVPLTKEKEGEVTGVTYNKPIAAISETCSGQLTNIPVTQLPHHEFKKPKQEPSSTSIICPIEFVPSVLEQPPVVGSTSGRKRNRKNKKAAEKKMRVDAQLPVVVLPLSQVPPCSVAQ